MIIEIHENSSYTIPNHHINVFKEFLSDNNDLPLRLNGNTISFDPYTVGSITIEDLVINIKPRIKNITANHYLEMQLYNEGLIDEQISSLLDENFSFGMQENIVELFLHEAFELVANGLEGDFIKVREESNKIKGQILVNEISPMNLILDRIPVQYDVHTLNTSYNKIIKLALDKVRILISNSSQMKRYAIINSYFEDIESSLHDIDILVHELKEKLYFINEKYPIVIGLAEKILKDLRLNLRRNKIKSSSYLVNSNSIFEEYVRKILTNNLEVQISKWDRPKKIGKYKVDDKEFIKSYIPDILVDYNYDSDSAYTVLDAKNKDISNYNKMGALPDLYQILFYCQSLNSNFGGLIYPHHEELDPIRVNISSFNETNIFIFSIDFSQPLKKRHALLAENIKNTLHL
ncbi:McrC family protein [Staphylococcus xylosus]|uniref:5-methylcytosine restriction system specificity protein McrC n=1 Tax=Staphylococcus xylosus TaxID=1288 RepID=UPI002DB55ADF|nr:hypothetical protein [Staphylococcus xylosus]MEB6299042.1 McrC family protein [Staphylococcus xylosus]